MDKNEAASAIRKYLTCTDITHSCNGKCEACRYHTNDDEKELALRLAIKALEGKDTNAPTNSALDHIHNVVRDDAYKRGYEQGKRDAKVKAIPVDWIESYLSDCAEGSIVYYIIKAMLKRRREEQKGEQNGQK